MYVYNKHFDPSHTYWCSSLRSLLLFLSYCLPVVSLLLLPASLPRDCPNGINLVDEISVFDLRGPVPEEEVGDVRDVVPGEDVICELLARLERCLELRPAD